jgi:hypothetical protein
VPVTTGIINGELVEVTEPEISGVVVTMGNHLLEDGSDITLPQIETLQNEQRPQRPQDENIGLKTIPVSTKSGNSQ